eukprot:Pgem_evm1s9059
MLSLLQNEVFSAPTDQLLNNNSSLLPVGSTKLPTRLKRNTDAESRRKLVWSEEFNSGSQINYDTWTGENENLHLNGEHQTYNQDHHRIENGNLILKATRNEGADQWTSGRFHTRGKKEFTYGYFETRCKMPALKGAFPAVWMMGTNYGGWPQNGEIDIIEYQSVWSRTKMTLHYGERNGGSPYNIGHGPHELPRDIAEWATYGIEKRQDYIAAFYNGEEVGRLNKPSNSNTYNWPFDDNNPFYFIVNLAIQPSWGSQPDNGVNEMEFEIDYVRVYE